MDLNMNFNSIALLWSPLLKKGKIHAFSLDADYEPALTNLRFD